jgi:adenylate cyclase
MGLALINVLTASSVLFTLVAYALLALRREEANAGRLLLNILPAPVAERMRAGETAIADSFPEVAILFADVVGFTPLAATRPAGEVVRLLDRVFTAFDEVAELWGVEKIKTVGDAYMAAAGLTSPVPNQAAVLAEVALAMRAAATRIGREEGLPMRLRVGIHEGPVVAGVIGRKRFAYDVWGDTVNLASRLETTAPPGAVQVSVQLAAKLEGRYLLRAREAVSMRGHGELPTFLLLGRRSDVPVDAFPAPRRETEHASACTGGPCTA